MVQPLGSISAVLSGPAGENSGSVPETVVRNLTIITATDTTHGMASTYGQPWAAMDSCFDLARPHQHVLCGAGA